MKRLLGLGGKSGNSEEEEKSTKKEKKRTTEFDKKAYMVKKEVDLNSCTLQLTLKNDFRKRRAKKV